MASIGVRAIKAPKFDPRAIERAILKEKRDKGEYIVSELEKTIQEWSGEKPSFKARVRDRGKDVVIEVTMTGSQHAIDKWMWLQEGTPRHDIPLVPSPNVRLAFNWPGFESKTLPNWIGSRKGKLAGGDLRRPYQVDHPGFPARKWIQAIRKDMNKTFGRRMRIVLKQAVEKSKR